MIDIAYEPHVLNADDNERLDAFLARKLPDYSRSFIQKLCREGNVTVDDVTQLKPSTHLQGTETIIVTMPVPLITATPVEVLFEDNDVVVLNKPEGMLTHAKGPHSNEFTIGEYMRSHTTDGVDTNRPGIVHRLDRGTSGIIVAAKHTAAKLRLQKQFSLRKVKKTYIALVEGHPKERSALIQLPIERNPKKPQTFRVGGRGRPAETFYETMRTFKSATLLKLKPLTGRTHQLRVHMQYLHCPIVGDSLYGKPFPRLGRMFLHATELEITLPSRVRKVFYAALPSQLQNYLDSLQ